MRIAVLGAGYAGLTLARRLERTVSDDHDLVVVNDSPAHLVQHELHRAIRRPAVVDDIVVPLEDVLDRATIRVARVTGVDPETNTATLVDAADGETRTARSYDADVDGGDDTDDTTPKGARAEDSNEETLEYDACAVCLGAETAFHGIPGVEEHATPLKRLPDAERIREEFLGFAGTGGRVVVGGAGLSGIQVAGELAALAVEEGVEDDVEVVLLEALDSVAPAFPANFQNAVREELESRGVVVRTNAPVERASAGSVTVDGAALPTEQLVWTGGLRGPAALDGERPVVRNTLVLGGRTFVVGDAARVVDADGEAVPASAQAAVREARVAATNIATIVERADRSGFRPRLEPFAFDSPGWLVSVGDGAVAQVGPTVFRGAAAKALKTTVGAGYLTSVGAVHNAVDLAREELSSDD